MTRWQSLGKLTISAILLAILYQRPGNWAFEPTGRAHCSCSFREMSFHELTVELSAFDASLRMRGAIARGLSETLPESLFLKALTEGLPMIRPGAVDICRPVMVRYSVIYGVTR